LWWFNKDASQVDAPTDALKEATTNSVIMATSLLVVLVVPVIIFPELVSYLGLDPLVVWSMQGVFRSGVHQILTLAEPRFALHFYRYHVFLLLVFALINVVLFVYLMRKAAAPQPTGVKGQVNPEKQWARYDPG